MKKSVVNKLGDYESIIERIRDEVLECDNTHSEMAQMIKAELYAYEQLIDEEKPYKIEMFDYPIYEEKLDMMFVGQICFREEDYENEIWYPIYPISRLEDEEELESYVVEYKVANVPISDI